MIEARVSVDVLRSASGEVGFDFELQDQLSGGWNFGAFRIATPFGFAVLKVHGGLTLNALEKIRSATEKAKSIANWPTPSWIATGEAPSGECWSIQELIQGSSPHILDIASADAIVRANQKQAAIADQIPELATLINRAEVARLMLEEDKWGHLYRLRTHSPAGTQLTTLLCPTNKLQPLPETDLVHGDYNQENILIADGEVTAFVDTDELGIGPRAFDLVDLFHRSLVTKESSDGRDLLRREAIDQIGEDGFNQCFATTAIGSMSWMIERMPQRVSERIDILINWVSDAD